MYIYEDDDLGGTLTVDVKPPELVGVVNSHRSALLEVRGDVARMNERIERMLPAAEAALRADRATPAAQWVPSGDEALLLARYVQADGSVLVGKSKRSMMGADGLPEEVAVDGFLTDPHPCTVGQANAQRAARGYAFAYGRAIARKTDPRADKLTRGAFALLRKHLVDQPGAVGAYFRAMFTNGETFKRAVMNGASTTGAEWLSVPTIGDLRRPQVLQRRLSSLINRRPAATQSFKAPLATGRCLPVKRVATTDDPSRYPIAGFTTSDVTISITNFTVQALLDPVWVADAGRMFDAMGEVMAFLDQGKADGEEALILHGDTAGTHQDTGIATWTLDSYFASGQLDGANALIKQFIGLRARAADQAKTASAGGSLGADDHFGALSALKTHAPGAVVAMGLNGYYANLLSNALFYSYNAIGPAATLITGGMGNLAGTPIVISEFLPKEFDTSNGLYTGSNKGNEFVYFDPSAWDLWELDGDSWDVTHPEQGAQYVGMMVREALSCRAPSSEYSEYVLFNLA